MASDSPLISSFSWGKVIVAGETFGDVMLFPGGAMEWDWGVTGTRHVPGIQVADVERLLPYKPDVVLLSRGVDLVLQVPDKTVQSLAALGIDAPVAQSKALVQKYNELVQQGVRVAALLHSTC